MRLLCGVLICFLYIFSLVVLVDGVHLFSFIQFTSAFSFLMLLFGVFLVSFNFKALIPVGRVVLGHRIEMPQARLAARWCEIIGTSAVWGGGACFLLGSVRVCRNFDKIEMLGPGFAVSALPIVYGLMFHLIVGRALKARFLQIAG